SDETRRASRQRHGWRIFRRQRFYRIVRRATRFVIFLTPRVGHVRRNHVATRSRAGGVDTGGGVLSAYHHFGRLYRAGSGRSHGMRATPAEHNAGAQPDTLLVGTPQRRKFQGGIVGIVMVRPDVVRLKHPDGSEEHTSE